MRIFTNGMYRIIERELGISGDSSVGRRCYQDDDYYGEEQYGKEESLCEVGQASAEGVDQRTRNGGCHARGGALGRFHRADRHNDKVYLIPARAFGQACGNGMGGIKS